MIAAVLVAAQDAHAVFEHVALRGAADLLFALVQNGLMAFQAVRPGALIAAHGMLLGVELRVLHVLIVGVRPGERMGAGVFVAALLAEALPEVMLSHGDGQFRIRAEFNRFIAVRAVEIVGRVAPDGMGALRDIGIRRIVVFDVFVTIFMGAGVFVAAGLAHAVLKVMRLQDLLLLGGRLVAPVLIAIRAVVAHERIAADDMALLAVGGVLRVHVTDPGIQILMGAGVFVAAVLANSVEIVVADQHFHLLSGRRIAPVLIALRAVVFLERIAADGMALLAVVGVLRVRVFGPGIRIRMRAGIFETAVLANAVDEVVDGHLL